MQCPKNTAPPSVMTVGQLRAHEWSEQIVGGLLFEY